MGEYSGYPFCFTSFNDILVGSLDDKLFSFWHLQAEAFPFTHVKGIYRFETGIKTSEFRDLRANPRCLLESQILSFRIRYARMRSSALYSRGNSTSQALSQIAVGLGLAFDPYSITQLPRRIIATGAAANFPSIVNLLGDIFNAPIFIPQTQLDSAHAVAPAGPGAGVAGGPKAQFAAAHRNSPAPGFPSRAALGGAYVARWAWSRERSAGSNAPSVSFEDEVRRLLTRRWNLKAKQHSGSGTHSPAPYLKHQRSAGLGADILVEEDEEEEETYRSPVTPGVSAGTTGSGYSAGSGFDHALGSAGIMPTTTPPPRVRTATGSSLATTASASVFSVSPSVSTGGSAFTSLTSPDLASSYGHPMGVSIPGSIPGHGTGASPIGAGAMTPTTDLNNSAAIVNSGTASGMPSTSGITPLTPVGALPTGDTEAQLGWVKVAESDVDAFMAYASIVPEFMRLEGLLIKALV